MDEGLQHDPAEDGPAATVSRDGFDILMSNSWFRELPQELVGKIFERSTIRALNNGDIVHFQGDASQGLYAVLSGSIKVSSIAPDGRECVFRYLSPGNWFGEIGMLDRSIRTHDAQAISDSELLVLSPAALASLLEEHPIFYKFLALLLCRVVRTAFTMLNDSTLLSIPARLAKRLVSFAEGYGKPHERGILIDLHLTQDDLAGIVNTTRQTVNKRLMDWQRLGWIDAGYGAIIVTNIDALKQLYQEGE